MINIDNLSLRRGERTLTVRNTHIKQTYIFFKVDETTDDAVGVNAVVDGDANEDRWSIEATLGGYATLDD